MSQRLEHFTACPGQFWGDLGGFKLCCWVWEGVTPPQKKPAGLEEEEDEEEALMG